MTWVWFLDDAARERLVDEGLVPQPVVPRCVVGPGSSGKAGPGGHCGHRLRSGPELAVGGAYAPFGLARAGGSFLDLCAAPGGKTALLVQLGSWRRAVAADLRPTRARLVRGLLERAGAASMVVADAGSSTVRTGWLGPRALGCALHRHRHLSPSSRAQVEAAALVGDRDGGPATAGSCSRPSISWRPAGSCSTRPVRWSRRRTRASWQSLPDGFEVVDLSTRYPQECRGGRPTAGERGSCRTRMATASRCTRFGGWGRPA